MHALDGLIQRLMELKVRFCKFKCTQGQGSLHRSLKIKDGIQCRKTKKWWLTIYLLTFKSKCSHPPVRAASVRTTMQTKMATSLTMPVVSSSRFLKFLTRFHKKSTHRNLLKTLMYKTQKNLQQWSHHAQPQIPNDPRISHSNLRKSQKNFTTLMPPLDPSAHDLQNLNIASPKMVVRTSTRHHRPTMTNSLAPQNCANLLTILEN